MDTQTRITQTIGSLVMQLAAAQAQIDELNAKLKEYEENNNQRNSSVASARANGIEMP